MGFSESVARRGLDVPWAEPALQRESGGDVQLYTLLKGLIARESAWNPGAFRWEAALNDGSYGLMQVLLSTAKGSLGNPSLTPSDLFIPDTNIAAGAAYLRYQLGRYGDARRAVSAYNCGSECLTRPTTFWPNGNAPYADDVLTYQAFYLNTLSATPAPVSPIFYEEYEAAESADQPPSDAWFPEIGSEVGIGLSILAIGAVAVMMMRRS